MTRASILKLLFTVSTLFINLSFSFAQGNQDFLRSTGKIYTVIIGVLLIFIGIFAYLWRLDKKLSKLENRFKDEHKTS